MCTKSGTFYFAPLSHFTIQITKRVVGVALFSICMLKMYAFYEPLCATAALLAIDMCAEANI